jgi:hypothetical protein
LFFSDFQELPTILEYAPLRGPWGFKGLAGTWWM